MSGQLVRAELEAFQTILGKAKPGGGETIKLWSRSTIANALHRLGPGGGLKAAADQAWNDADLLADHLDRDRPSDEVERARDQASASVAVLIATVNAIKAHKPSA